jgi:hypothetical protein
MFRSQLGDLVQERLQAANQTSLPSPSSPVERRGNVDLYYSSIENQTIGICHLYTILPFTNGDKRIFNTIGTYEGAVAIALAATHLNTGNSSIISELEGLPERCPLRFTMELVDTELQESIAMNKVIEATNRPLDGSSSKTLPPCAFVGDSRSADSIPTSIITGLRGYPQISPGSTSVLLNNKAQFPLFARTIPSDDSTAVSLVLYFRDVLKIQHLGVVHMNSAYGIPFAEGIVAAAIELAPEMLIRTVDVPVDATPETIEFAVSFLRATDYTYFFGILGPTKVLDSFLFEAHAQGLVGNGMNWMFSDTVGGDIVSRTFEKGSSLEQAFMGSGMLLSSSGNSDVNPKLGQLTTAMKGFKDSVSDLEYIDSILPKHPGEPNFGDGFDLYAEEFLRSPGPIGGFVYDAVIAIGLAACQAWENDEILIGTEHYRHLVSTSFAGTSGDVVLDTTTGSRTANSSYFQVMNYVVDEEKTTENVTQYREVLSYMFQDGQWRQLADYIFNDGTSVPSQDLRLVTLVSRNFSVGVRAGGLSLCGLAMTMALGFAGWTWFHRKHRVLMASQPIFLYLICGGVVVLVATIIPLSMDELLLPRSGCDIACRSIPWLLSLGFSLIGSALFTKTYRINKIFSGAMRMRRVAVRPVDVAKPMILLLGGNVLILSLWTALSPLSWGYVNLELDAFGRVTQRYGYCSGANMSTLRYLLPLATLNFGILVLSLVQAYKARNISTQYAETEYIYLSMLFIVAASILGVPILILAREDPDAFFFIFSGLLFATSLCILMLIFVPKVAFLQAQIKNATTPGSRTGVRLTDGTSISRVGRVPSDVCDDSGTSESGLLILTRKSKRKLLAENRELRRRLEQYEPVTQEERQQPPTSIRSVETNVEISVEESNVDCSGRNSAAAPLGQ